MPDLVLNRYYLVERTRADHGMRGSPNDWEPVGQTWPGSSPEDAVESFLGESLGDGDLEVGETVEVHVEGHGIYRFRFDTTLVNLTPTTQWGRPDPTTEDSWLRAHFKEARYEREASHGDIIETSNGNRYLIQDLPSGRVQFYVGNACPALTDLSSAIPERPDSMCVVIHTVRLPVS